MRKTWIGAIGLAALAVSVVSGCSTTGGTANNTVSSNSNSAGAPSAKTTPTKSQQGGNMIVGAKQYEGKSNLTKYEDAAKSKPSDAQAQIDAGIASHVNGNDTQAIAYYKKAISIDPKSALAYTNLGNIYLRDKHDAKTAVGYYQKATQADPTYGFGWLNLEIAESELGNKTAAKAAVEDGLKQVKQSDPAYKSLEQIQKQMNSTK
ncbi:tetratricopeptide repeat protein [Alicyclobacillus dauci]|uniref:Tetratricopeptide repeat protein n=1 Tax=Alicyclobacillus dauci TaxID=1475485 RepID=A0ABY6Z248_9BACL|nr:tetratricopeptide repeat protein [Alicyclobacillus dauci]WAH36820.1 tetratricopeptide repeat protein [Alicyclobacillus dauci]